MARPIARWGAALVFGALWWWAVLRLALVPDAGAPEAAVAAGGWGLSLLPVHCVPKARAVGAMDPRRWARAWRAGRKDDRMERTDQVRRMGQAGRA